MPDIKFPTVDINKAAAEVNNAVKEGAYVAVGLGVLGFQRAQVQRVELTKQLEAQLSQLSSLPTTLNEQLDNYFSTAREQAAGARVQIAEQLSGLSKSIEEAFAPVRAQLSNVVSTDFPKFPGELIEGQIETARTQLSEFAKAVEERVAPARQQIDEQIDRLEQVLPAGARNVVQSVRAAAATQEQVIRSAVGLD